MLPAAFYDKQRTFLTHGLVSSFTVKLSDRPSKVYIMASTRFVDEGCYESASPLDPTDLEVNLETAAVRFFEAARANKKYKSYTDDELTHLIRNDFSFVDTEEELASFLRTKVPAGFQCDEEMIKIVFSLSQAVFKISLKAVKTDDTDVYYSGTGTIFNLNGKAVIFTNKHVLDVPKDGKDAGEEAVGWFAIVGGALVDIGAYNVTQHPELHDVVKIEIPDHDMLKFPLPFSFENPRELEIDRHTPILQCFPTTEKATDTGYIFIAVGHPLGLPKKRVSAAAACKRIELVDGFLTHRAPTFQGSSGSIVFAFLMYKGEDGEAQVKHVRKQLAPNSLKSIAGIHYRKSDAVELNGFVSLTNMVNF